MPNMSNRPVTIVSGAAGGIGRATARVLGAFLEM